MSELEELIARCPGEEAKKALRAKLHLIARERDDRAASEFHKVSTAMAGGRRGNWATAPQLWEGAERETDVAIERMIDACLGVGVGDVEAIARFVAEDARASLTAFATSRIRPTFGGVAQELISHALARAGRVKARVTSMKFDREQRSAGMSNITVAVHGGNVQIGDGNNQTITCQTLLTNLAEAIDKSPEAPPEKKAEWAKSLRELAAHPLTQTLLSAAAGLATGGR